MYSSINRQKQCNSSINLINPRIDVVPFPKSFDGTGRAVLPPPPAHRSKETGWKEECKPDLVVMCTGYRQDWSWLGEGYPKGPDECDVRGVCSSKDPSIAFIGFLRPGVGMCSPDGPADEAGAIPPMAEMQVQLFLLLSADRIPTPTSPENYHLLHSPTSRIQYGVDYSTYMAQLAKDMGSAPSLKALMVEYGWFVTFLYWYVSYLACPLSTRRS
jgi:dimethylaniline monooxygenase (N-oxide forming)